MKYASDVVKEFCAIYGYMSNVEYRFDNLILESKTSLSSEDYAELNDIAHLLTIACSNLGRFIDRGTP